MRRTAEPPRAFALPGGRGTLTVDASGHAYLVLSRLLPAPPGRAYEVWVVSGGNARPAALFAQGGSSIAVPLAVDVQPGATVLVTVEPAGGAARPGPRVVVAATVPAA